MDAATRAQIEVKAREIVTNWRRAGIVKPEFDCTGRFSDDIATALLAAREAGFREGLEKGTQMGVEAVDRLGKATVEYLDPENAEAVKRVARAIYDADQYLEANPWQAAARAVLAALRREGQ